MRLKINGELKEFQDSMSLLDIMKQLHIETKVMAAAVNMNIVKQDKWGTYIPKEDDVLEMLDFVGGG